nr:hypothetical protein [Tanacetum cinerariifolium]
MNSDRWEIPTSIRRSRTGTKLLANLCANLGKQCLQGVLNDRRKVGVDLLHVRDPILRVYGSCRLLKGMGLLLVKAFKPRVNSNWWGISTSIRRSRHSTELLADLLANLGKQIL